MNITIPDEIMNSAKLTVLQLQQELAVYLYSKNKLSFGQARKLAGMDVLQFQELLFINNVPLHYGVSDLQDDFDSIQQFGKK